MKFYDPDTRWVWEYSSITAEAILEERRMIEVKLFQASSVPSLHHTWSHQTVGFVKAAIESHFRKDVIRRLNQDASPITINDETSH